MTFWPSRIFRTFYFPHGEAIIFLEVKNGNWIINKIGDCIIDNCGRIRLVTSLDKELIIVKKKTGKCLKFFYRTFGTLKSE